jgi:hypothetical protein
MGCGELRVAAGLQLTELGRALSKAGIAPDDYGADFTDGPRYYIVCESRTASGP